jgi:hypothetical protein
VRRGLEPAWSDKQRLEQGMSEAAAQLARTSEALARPIHGIEVDGAV